MTDYTFLGSLIALGAFHGVNPGMGWLFAVALGLQERRRGAVLAAFGPIALGHALSVSAMVLLVSVLATQVDLAAVQLLGAVSLVAFGVWKLVRPLSHPRWVGMRVGARDLVVWSFLMATAHGAGLMLVPVLLRQAGPSGGHAVHAAPAAPEMLLSASTLDGLGAVLVHSASMFVVMALVAILVYERLGLAVLRRAWLNVDRLWAGALIGAGWVTLVW